MGAYDGVDERQSQAVAIRVLPLHAALKDMGADVGLETWSVIFHNEQRGAFRCAKGNGYGA